MSPREGAAAAVSPWLALRRAWLAGTRAFVMRGSWSVTKRSPAEGVPAVPASAAFWFAVGSLALECVG